MQRFESQRYEVGPVIGQGAVGVVHEGRQLGLERPVAIKVLRGEFAQDEVARKRFIEEARVLASLHGGQAHPAIVQVIEVVDDFLPGADPLAPGRPAIVMELLRGETLRDRLKRGAMPAGEAVTLLQGVLGALSIAHERPQGAVVHRDIKPANIFLCSAGRVVLTDFGIARVVGAAALTKTNGIVGTVEYMSPEQAQGKPADARADVYACGVVLHEMLAGAPPFHAETPVAVALQHLHKAPPPLPPSVPLPLRQAVSKALAKDPARRFQSAREFASSLEGAPDAGRKVKMACAGVAAFGMLMFVASAATPRARMETLTQPIPVPPAHTCALNARCETVRQGKTGTQRVTQRVTTRWWSETGREAVGDPVVVSAALAPQVKEQSIAGDRAIPFKTRQRKLADRPAGENRVVTRGREGHEQLVATKIYSGTRLSSQKSGWETIAPAQEEVVEVGTLKVPVVQPARPVYMVRPAVRLIRVKQLVSSIEKPRVARRKERVKNATLRSRPRVVRTQPNDSPRFGSSKPDVIDSPRFGSGN